MLVTEDVSQLLMSVLKKSAFLNSSVKLATPAVFHEAMGPYVPCAAAGSEKNKATALRMFAAESSVVEGGRRKQKEKARNRK